MEHLCSSPVKSWRLFAQGRCGTPTRCLIAVAAFFSFRDLSRAIRSGPQTLRSYPPTLMKWSFSAPMFFQFMRSRNRCSGPKIERFPQKMGLSLVSFPFAFSERMSIDRCNSDRCLNPSCKSTKGLVKISLLLSRLSPDTCCLKFYSLNLRSEHRELGDKEIHGSGFKITPGLLRTRAF